MGHISRVIPQRCHLPITAVLIVASVSEVRQDDQQYEIMLWSCWNWHIIMKFLIWTFTFIVNKWCVAFQRYRTIEILDYSPHPNFPIVFGVVPLVGQFLWRSELGQFRNSDFLLKELSYQKRQCQKGKTNNTSQIGPQANFISIILCFVSHWAIYSIFCSLMHVGCSNSIDFVYLQRACRWVHLTNESTYCRTSLLLQWYTK